MKIDWPCFRPIDLSFFGRFGLRPDVLQHVAGPERTPPSGSKPTRCRWSARPTQPVERHIRILALLHRLLSQRLPPAITTICCRVPEAFSNTEMENMCMTAVNEGAAGIDGAVNNPLFEVDVAPDLYEHGRPHPAEQDPQQQLHAHQRPREPDEWGAAFPNGMVYVSSGIGYGFQDTVGVTGNDFYCSLLDVQASNQLAALLTAAGNTSAAATWTAAARAETTAIQNTFWNSSDGMFHASTGTCSNNISVWGSAFAVTSGVATSSQSSWITNYFNNNYSNLVLNGQIREIPNPTYWARLLGSTRDGPKRRLLGPARGTG